MTSEARIPLAADCTELVFLPYNINFIAKIIIILIIKKGGRGYLCFFNNKCWLYRIACGGKDVILQLNIN